MHQFRKGVLTGCGLLACAALAAGCQSDNVDNVSYDHISDNLTPELLSSIERPVDVDRNLAVTNNQNWRMFWDDLGRTFYTDRPSALSPFPIPKTSGQPY